MIITFERKNIVLCIRPFNIRIKKIQNCKLNNNGCHFSLKNLKYVMIRQYCAQDNRNIFTHSCCNLTSIDRLYLKSCRMPMVFEKYSTIPKNAQIEQAEKRPVCDAVGEIALVNQLNCYSHSPIN